MTPRPTGGAIALVDAMAASAASWQQRRVAQIVWVVPAVLLLAGALSADMRVALLAGIVVIGWTQLVGL